jgi:hypothetical protein
MARCRNQDRHATIINLHQLSIKKLSLMTKKQTEHTLSKTDEAIKLMMNILLLRNTLREFKQ